MRTRYSTLGNLNKTTCKKESVENSPKHLKIKWTNNLPSLGNPSPCITTFQG
jgi:hypothetical protein